MDDSNFNIDLQEAVAVLRRGGIILYPTDTVWGLGCDATNDEAIERLFALKQRPSSKAMISLVDSVETLNEWLNFVPERAVEEIEATAEPLTVIFDSPAGLSSSLVAEDGSAAFRIPKLHFTRELCRVLGKPLVSTSVNVSGKPAASSFDEIDGEIIESVDYVCRYGRETKGGSPSRILKITDEGKVTVIR